ncbi:MAG TPA: DUF4384 domain-containing protein [Spirochaetes bacterium]|nr:DUF4384 domain-containing protein [Spirochaetota bacterium]
MKKLGIMIPSILGTLLIGIIFVNWLGGEVFSPGQDENPPLISKDNIQLHLVKENLFLENLDPVSEGQQFVLQVKTNKPAYLYVMEVGPAKRIFAIFPNKRIKKSNPIDESTKYSFPSPKKAYEFGTKKGVQMFYIVASTKAVPALERLLSVIPRKGLRFGRDDKKALDQLTYYIPAGRKKQNLYFKKLVLVHKGKKGAKVKSKWIKRAKKEILEN